MFTEQNRSRAQTGKVNKANQGSHFMRLSAGKQGCGDPRLTFAEDMRFKAMLPDASTTKITSAPALRASRLLRISGFSTYTCGIADEAAQHLLNVLCDCDRRS